MTDRALTEAKRADIQGFVNSIVLPDFGLGWQADQIKRLLAEHAALLAVARAAWELPTG